MRLMHLADLHIGKRVNGYSMLEDQRYVLQQVLELVRQEQVDAVLMAGDLYDKGVPAVEAVQLMDWFLTELAACNVCIYMISGNHDSGERLSFGARLFENSHIYMVGTYDGSMDPIVLEDAYGVLNLYLMPFIKPVYVNWFLRQEEKEPVDSYDAAVAEVIRRAQVDPEQRNILVAHQTVLGAQRCESEEVSIGGLEQVSVQWFDAFDYVALGHLHGPQKVGREGIQYAGSLLKYSFSELQHVKSVPIVTIREKGDIQVERYPVRPLHEMREVRGTYAEVMSRRVYAQYSQEDYVRVILTDEEDIPEGSAKLHTVYHNLMELQYDNKRTRKAVVPQALSEIRKAPLEYIESFYEQQNNQMMSDGQQRLAAELVEEIWGNEE